MHVLVISKYKTVSEYVVFRRTIGAIFDNIFVVTGYTLLNLKEVMYTLII